MPDEPENGSKLVARTAQRTQELLSKWAVPSLLVVVIGMGKLGYDGMLAANKKTTEDTLEAIAKLRTDVGLLQDTQAVRNTQITLLERSDMDNREWRKRVEDRQERTVQELTAIRLLIARQQQNSVRPEDGSGSIPPMLWHF